VHIEQLHHHSTTLMYSVVDNTSSSTGDPLLQDSAQLRR